jgi:hypothetical protein
MKHLLILISISLAGCQSSFTVNDTYQSNDNIVGLGVNFTRDFYYSLPDYAMEEKQRCVDFAIREMQVGEECKWIKGDAIGIVQLAKIDANQCHTVLNTIYYKNKPKYFQENYCYNYALNKWKKVM